MMSLLVMSNCRALSDACLGAICMIYIISNVSERGELFYHKREMRRHLQIFITSLAIPNYFSDFDASLNVHLPPESFGLPVPIQILWIEGCQSYENLQYQLPTDCQLIIDYTSSSGNIKIAKLSRNTEQDKCLLMVILEAHQVQCLRPAHL